MSYPSQNPLSSIPPVTLNVLIAITVMFIFQNILPGNNFIYQYFVLYPFENPYFYPWQLLTYGLLHFDFMHLFFNGFAIWMFGSQIERQWGEKRYIIFIIACIIGSGIAHALLSPAPVIGISGAVFGLLVAFGMMFPESRIFLLFPPMPIKAKYFVAGYAIITLILSIRPGTSNVAHIAHLGGAITGFLLIQYWRKKPPFRFK